ncbi:MAG: hypothetical protein JOZ82_05245 [Marmoricola sp.]|nr:hypothetical protein [Marmoricola sp.]
MALIKTVEHLARGAVGTTTHVVLHPVSTAANVVGFARGIAASGADLVRSSDVPRQRGGEAAPTADWASTTDTPETTEPAAEVTDQEPEQAVEPDIEPDIELPGPDIVLKGVPDPDDLPEPIVIEADDEPGEAFHTEPKAASRVSEHEGLPGDREEAEGYVEEVIDPEAPDIDIETPVGTTGADVGFNPDTAESDLQQPGTPPIGGRPRD